MTSLERLAREKANKKRHPSLSESDAFVLSHWHYIPHPIVRNILCLPISKSYFFSCTNELCQDLSGQGMGKYSWQVHQAAKGNVGRRVWNDGIMGTGLGKNSTFPAFLAFAFSCRALRSMPFATVLLIGG